MTIGIVCVRMGICEVANMYLFIVSVCVVNSVATSRSSLMLLYCAVQCCAERTVGHLRSQRPACTQPPGKWGGLLDPAQFPLLPRPGCPRVVVRVGALPLLFLLFPWFPGGDSVLACWCLVSVAGPVWSSGCRFLWMCGVWPVYVGCSALPRE